MDGYREFMCSEKTRKPLLKFPCSQITHYPSTGWYIIRGLQMIKTVVLVIQKSVYN